jgi:phosphoribosylformimino-5-aminoimidazole carboxamide ribotide isomerase
MIIYPAIDIIDGKCVRLEQGDFDRKKIYDDDPVEMAKSFEAIGASYLHVVDLDGTKSGGVRQTSLISSIAKETNLKFKQAVV